MTQEEYFKRFLEKCDQMIRTTKAKNTDYAESSDAFANFKMIEQMTHGRITVADGIVVRMTDKLKRISSLLAREAAVSEKIEDTVLDMAVYSLILLIWLEHKIDVEKSPKENYMASEEQGKDSLPTKEKKRYLIL